MTDGAWQVVGTDYRELPLGTTIGDALRRLVRERFRNNAAKNIETRWGLDPRTARNVVTTGNVSERTLTKAAVAERWTLWMALGEELFGETYEAWEEQRLKSIIEEAERDLDRVRRLRPLAAALPEKPLEKRATGVVVVAQGDEPAGRGEGGGGVRALGRRTRR